jgi:hypothetical protein
MAESTVRRAGGTRSRLAVAVLLASSLSVGVVAAGAGVATANNPTNANSGDTGNSGTNSGNTNTSTNQGTSGSGGTNNNTTNSSTTSSSQPNGNNNGTTGNGTTNNSNGASGNQSGTSGQTNETTTTTSPPPPVVATLTGTGDGVLVHRYNGTTVTGYAGQPLRLHEVVEVVGPPGQPTDANPATIEWNAGGTSQVYDAKPQHFVAAQGFVGRVHTQVDVNFGPGGGASSVRSGFMRFFFPSGDTKRYKFEASTGTVVTGVKGTDFTIGYDPDTKTSAVFVTQDSVDVTPTNTSLKPFTLSAGQQVEVTASQVGPVTPLGGAATQSPTTQPTKSSSSSSVGLVVGIVVGILVLAALALLLIVYLPRRRRSADRAAEAASAQTQQAPAVEGSLISTQPTAAVQPVAPAAAGSWSPTHRAPEGGIGCWSAPDLSGPVVATLDPGLEVEVVERRDQWAHVLCSNGWSAWVDARLLVTNGDGQGT